MNTRPKTFSSNRPKTYHLATLKSKCGIPHESSLCPRTIYVQDDKISLELMAAIPNKYKAKNIQLKSTETYHLATLESKCRIPHESSLCPRTIYV
jgi:hypothetical protein